ncbi:hypothetical protein HDU86_007043 [Geranomyces michiganensis]|nr:hypothetical protein HDU86_007043 [Geranomyces michiganensis]
MADRQNGTEFAGNEAAGVSTAAGPMSSDGMAAATNFHQANPTTTTVNSNHLLNNSLAANPEATASGLTSGAKKRFTPEQTAALRSRFTPEGKLEDHILNDLLQETGLTEKQASLMKGSDSSPNQRIPWINQPFGTFFFTKIKTWWSRERSSHRKATINQASSATGTPITTSPPNSTAPAPANPPNMQSTWQTATSGAPMITPLYQFNNYGGMPLGGVPATITTPLPTYPLYNYPQSLSMPQYNWDSSLLPPTAISPVGGSFSSAPSLAVAQSQTPSPSPTGTSGGPPSALPPMPPATLTQAPSSTATSANAARSTNQPSSSFMSYLSPALHNLTAPLATTTGATVQPSTYIPQSFSYTAPPPSAKQLPATPPVADSKSAMDGVVHLISHAATSPTPARSPSPVKIPTIEEEIQLLMDDNGEITDMPAYAKLVSSQTEWDSRAKVLAPLNSTANLKTLQSFRRQQGLKLVTKLLLQSKDQLDDSDATSVAVVALQILLKMPVSIDELKEVKTGKVVKHFATAAAGDKGSEIHEAAKKVMDSWQALVANASAKESVSPTTTGEQPFHDKPNERKRDRDAADEDPAAAKRVKSDDAVKRDSSSDKDKRKSIATTGLASSVTATSPASATAVADMDIFKSLAHTSLPKIKKVEPKAVDETTKPAAEAKAAPSTTESRTATVGTFALPVAESIPSYRKDPSASNAASASASASVSASSSSAPAKRRVRFAEGDKLVSVRFFETDTGHDKEAFNITPHMHGNARDFDRQEGKRAFRKELHQAKEWVPPPLINAPETYEWGKNSMEDKIQEERERTLLGVAYYSDNQIPPSATEPTEPAAPPPHHPPKPILWEAPPPPPVAAVPFAPFAAPLAGGLDLGNINSLLGMLQNSNVQASNNPQQSLLAALQQPAAQQAPQQPNIASLLSRLAQQPQLNLASLLSAAASAASPIAQPSQQQPQANSTASGVQSNLPGQQQQHQQQQQQLQQQYKQPQQQYNPQQFRPNMPGHMGQQHQQHQQQQPNSAASTSTTNSRSRWGPPPPSANPIAPGNPQLNNSTHTYPYQQHQQPNHHHQRGASHNTNNINRGGARGGGFGAGGRAGPYDRPGPGSAQGAQMAPGSMDRPCNNFVATGMCRWGDRCAFRHDVKQ